MGDEAMLAIGEAAKEKTLVLEKSARDEAHAKRRKEKEEANKQMPLYRPFFV